MVWEASWFRCTEGMQQRGAGLLLEPRGYLERAPRSGTTRQSKERPYGMKTRDLGA